ncbi:MAG: DUF1926 domain-containing protein [Spirochaetia bacterium]|nr:DUF1926 domain-containing protein [Spirochaetia bacterium]
MVYVSFNLRALENGLDTNDALIKNYQTVYTPLVKFLYSHPHFKFTFSFNGSQILFFHKKRSEFISILREMTDRKQIEILGGGYYSPVLPLLGTVDRNGQIDLLNLEIRQAFGKRPRGVTLFADCWDSSLVTNLKICGIEYVLLDSSLIPLKKRKYLPIIMAEQGKSIQILPYYDDFLPSADTTPEEFVSGILKSVEKISKKDTYVQMNPDRLVSINLTHEKLIQLVECKWFEKLDEYLQNNPELNIGTITTGEFRKSNTINVPAHISGGLKGSLAEWLNKTYKIDESKNNKISVYDYLDTNYLSHNLYNRIIYISMLVNQYKYDKMRKQEARLKLWEAENGIGLLFNSDGSVTNSASRQKAYKHLVEAEKILREDPNFKETVTAFDYNADGLNEYVCRMQNYFAYISLLGGTVQELDILKNTGNYADNYSRKLEFDDCDDNYERGLFVDHIFTEEQYINYCKKLPSGHGVFSQIQYSENKFSQKHNEIQLSASALFMPTKQKISLRKKYIITSNGMIVQYILKNESNTKFEAKFVSESNLAHTNYNNLDTVYYNLEAIENDNKVYIDSQKAIFEQKNTNYLENIDIVRITDGSSGISFAFEPNEKCNYSYYPLTFKRPLIDTDELENVHMTFVSSLCWNISLEPGMETEKTISFSITSVKKEKRNMTNLRDIK